MTGDTELNNVDAFDSNYASIHMEEDENFLSVLDKNIILSFPSFYPTETYHTIEVIKIVSVKARKGGKPASIFCTCDQGLKKLSNYHVR